MYGVLSLCSLNWVSQLGEELWREGRSQGSSQYRASVCPGELSGQRRHAAQDSAHLCALSEGLHEQQGMVCCCAQICMMRGVFVLS